MKTAAVRQCAADLRVDEGFAQRRARIPEQHFGQDSHREQLERVDSRHGDPPDESLGLARVVVARGGRVGLDRCDGLLESSDVWDRRVDGEPLELRQCVFFDRGEGSIQRLVAIGVEVRVARVVVRRVKAAQLLPGEIGDVLRVSARIIGVGQTRKQRAAQVALHGRLRRRQRTFHLVEDHALVTEPARGLGRILELEADSLLLERVLLQQREEGRIEVHEQQIHVIVGVAGAERIRGRIGARECVHESRERTPRHAEEGIAHREASRSCQHHVLQDVSHACRVRGDGRKGHGEGVVVIHALDMNVPGPGALMNELDE
jgi:hypothetical protein